MQNTVRFENAKRLDERLAGVKPPSFTREPHPVDIELIWPHAIDSGESRVELLAAIVFHARPVALDEEGIDYPEGSTCPDCPYWARRDRWTGELGKN
ncbi:hypothetical protein [Mesorhizobium delmotii]|uniref:Uncharacterized protein n=1 Tax=Mesorhizobium delmotii TaxID=1631247 RepID=A0A2P9ARK9_9HYPH|nr:hypothetical protein [Mesorhizobium delmotii]SJM33792.1 hypothetical protein BQ8482_370012 [Mesorhizobium delmotii]